MIGDPRAEGVTMGPLVSIGPARRGAAAGREARGGRRRDRDRLDRRAVGDARGRLGRRRARRRVRHSPDAEVRGCRGRRRARGRGVRPGRDRPHLRLDGRGRRPRRARRRIARHERRDRRPRGRGRTDRHGSPPSTAACCCSTARTRASSTGHGSPLPHLVHGGPGRAGGGEELGGIRAVLHHMQRTADPGLARHAHRADRGVARRRGAQRRTGGIRSASRSPSCASATRSSRRRAR